MRISVIGGSRVADENYERARELGQLLADRGHTVVCGGLGGVMEAVCQGATDNGGHTIGILPGSDRSVANPYVETVIATGMGNARNALVALNGDGVIAVDGNTGTLSELALALDYDRPVAGLATHRIESVDSIEHVTEPLQAVEYVENSYVGN